jgi:uncharacterized protein YutE (UPF0331/DUF86 family)
MDLEVVLVRLRLITKYLNTLEEFRDVTIDEYLDNFRHQLSVERLLQLMAEAATDINKYMLVQLHQISPDTSGNSFIEAGEQGIIAAELAAELAKAARMRNILVHQYKDIDSSIVFTGIAKALQQYPLYIQQVTTYLDSMEAND